MSTWQTPYMGRPGAMRALPTLADKYSAPEDFGESTTRTASGGAAINRRLFGKKTYTLPYTWLDVDEARVLTGFYQRMYGTGPWVYVDPHAVNVLSADVASCGVRSNAPHGWVASSATSITRETTDTPPAEQPDSGVIRVNNPAAGCVITPGSTADTADTLTAPAYVPDLPVAVSAYVKASASTTVRVQVGGYDAAGALVSSSVSQSVSVSTSWQRLTVAAAAGDAGLAGSVFVLPRLVVMSGALWVQVAAVQLEYADAVSGWTWGSGARRVNIAGPIGEDVQLLPYSDHTLTLVEV